MKRYISSANNQIDIRNLFTQISKIAEKYSYQISDETGNFNQNGSIATIYPGTNSIIDNIHVWFSNNNEIVVRINFYNAHSITNTTNISSDLNSSIDTLTTSYNMVSEIQKI